MKSTPLTQGVTLLIFAVYILFGIFALPFAGLLMSLAIGLIVYAVNESFEMSVALVMLTGVMYSLIAKSGALKATQKYAVREGFSNDGAEKIAKRVERIYKANVEPHGVYASAFVEGFQDVSNLTDEEKAKITNGGDKAAASSDSTTDGSSHPASANSSGGAGSGIPPAEAPAVTTAVEGAMRGTESFKGNSDDSKMFKLGVLPSEEKDGVHIDQGTTVMNALNSLKPDQLKAMTKDTQQLIDTQKNLMSLLGTMKPLLQDGKQMMETFTQMFGDGQLKM